jgi:hypothetical protein
MATQSLEYPMHDNFLLGLMMTTQPSDNLAHPLAVILTGEDARAIVHNLHLHPVLDAELPAFPNFRNTVRVAARSGQLDAPLGAFLEPQ